MSNLMAMFVVVATLGVLAQARHTHPHQTIHEVGDAGETFDTPRAVADEDSIDINNLNVRYVPPNNDFFFRLYSTCQEGYRRDFRGICREVW